MSAGNFPSRDTPNSPRGALQRILLWALTIPFLLLLGLPGLLYSMAKHGQISGPIVPVIFAVYLVLFTLGGILSIFSPSADRRAEDPHATWGSSDSRRLGNRGHRGHSGT